MSICVHGLDFAYGERQILNQITFSANSGDVLAVLGPNGVGKSSLFQCILGLRTNYRGSVLVSGQEAKHLSAKQLALELAYIPQADRSAFHFTVLDMVLMGTTPRLGLLQQPGAAERQQALQALERFRILHLAARDYGQLSGGESQLTLLARAVAQGARILVMDEPTASLDYGHAWRVMEEIQALAKEGFTVLFSTHDPNQALSYANRVLALHHGRVAAFGATEQVLQPELLQQLYQISVRFETMGEERRRVCIPLPRKDGLCEKTDRP